MSYIDQNLMPGEKVLHKASIHWIIFVPAFIYTSIGLVLFCYTPYIATDQIRHLAPLAAAIVMFLGACMFLKGFIYRQTTEFAVTNVRVMVKTGWIRTNRVELRHEKIEGLNMEQTIMGRILNYGTLALSGTGGDKTLIPNISDPARFCNQAMASLGQLKT